MIKILKNDLKSCIEPEEHKYVIVDPNNLQMTHLEVLPDLLPVYAKIPCSCLRTPLQLEVNMGKMDALLILASNSHKFP